VRPEDALDDELAGASRDLTATRAELVGLLRTEESAEQTLERLAALACATIPRCRAASLTQWRDGKPYTVVSSDPLAQEIDNHQYELLEGPCLDASRYGEAYRVDDMAEEGRWPVFTDVARSRGVVSSLSQPLVVRGEVIGALNLYATQPRAFAEVGQIVEGFAAQAGTTIANADLYRASRTLAEQLQEALASRAVIEQAKGVLMAEQGCGPDDAFDLLRQASQRENVKVRDVAQRIVDGQAARKR
jgi:GAF domain-containing protein